MKRFGAMLLTMAMLLSLAVTGVSAEGTTPTLSADNGKTVNITFKGLGTDNDSIDELKAYKVIAYDSGYNDFVDAKGVAGGQKSFWEYLETNKGGSADAIAYLNAQNTPDALRTLLKKFMNDTGYDLPTAEEFTATNTKATVDVKPGYYILKVKSPSKIYDTMLLFVGYEKGQLVAKIDAQYLTVENGVYNATMKSEDGPKVEKKVFDDRQGATKNELENVANWKTAAASEVGKAVKFAVKVTLPTYQNDAEVALTLKDTLKNLKYTGTKDNVTVYNENGIEVANAVDEVTSGTDGNNNQTLDIKLNYNNLKASNVNATVFYVYYEATLTEGAVANADASNHQSGINTVYMNYTVATSTGDYNGKSAESAVTVYTYNFKLDKKYNGEDKSPSTAAQFSVYASLNENGSDVGTNKMLTFKLADGGYYYPSNETDAVKSIPANFEIRGLDVSTPYYVKEVETPAGYYAPSSYFTLQLSGDEKAATTVLNGALKHEGAGENNYKKPSSFVAAETVDQALVMNDHEGKTSGNGQNYGNINTNKKYEYDVTLNNSTTPVLPSTGGMGTTLFTVGGVALLALAAAMLILRRRKN